MDNSKSLIRPDGTLAPYWTFKFPSTIASMRKSLQLFKYCINSPTFPLSEHERIYMSRAEESLDVIRAWNKGKEKFKDYVLSDDELRSLQHALAHLGNMFSRTPEGFGTISFVSIASKVQEREIESGRGKHLMQAAVNMRVQAHTAHDLVVKLIEEKERLHNP